MSVSLSYQVCSNLLHQPQDTNRNFHVSFSHRFYDGAEIEEAEAEKGGRKLPREYTAS